MLFAAGILTACQADYNEPQPGPDAPGEALGLTVSACDMVVTGGASSRVADSGSATVFNVGDTVGLTIIDDKDELVIDNVPYKLYNSLDEEGNVTGRYWGIDVEKAGGLEQIFYDRTMKTYIVYYPYDKSVTGCKSISEIQYLEVFDIRENQREELDYRFSDLMACTGNVTPQISADLEHLRNCFCLDPKCGVRSTTARRSHTGRKDTCFQPTHTPPRDMNAKLPDSRNSKSKKSERTP